MAERRRWSTGAKLVVAALAATTFVVSLIVAVALFPHQSVNNDEAVYTFQASIISQGELTLPAATHQDFFRPWMSGAHGDRQVLVFQPVFPATLAVSQWLFHTMRVAPALIAAACVVLMALFVREAFDRERTAVIAAALVTLSPFAIIHGALYLEYLYALALELATLLLVLQGRRLGSTVRLVAAGATLGVLFFMRPFDAVLLGLALAIFLGIEDRRALARLARTLAWGAVGAVPFVGLCFAYNWHVTGSALRFPLWVIGGSNEFGFGTRYIVAGAPVMHVTVGKTLEALQVNLRSFPHWIAGSVVAVPLGLVGLWRLRRHRVTPLLVAIAVIVPVGYLFYWGNVLITFGRKYFGPHYYLALLIPGCAMVARGIEAVFDQRRTVGYAACAALLVATGIELPDKISHNADATRVFEAEQAALDTTVTDQAIVLLPTSRDGAYVLHPRGWLQNPPDLRGRVLYAADRGGDNVDLFRQFPSRSIYRLQEAEGPGRGSTFHPDVRRLQMRTIDTQLDATVTASNETGGHVAVLYASIASIRDGRTAWSGGSCVLDRASTAGARYVQHVHADATGVDLPCAGAPVHLALPGGTGTLAVGISIGRDENLDTASLSEFRMWYRTDAARTLSVVTPAEQWRREPGAMQHWNVTTDNPAIALDLGPVS